MIWIPIWMFMGLYVGWVLYLAVMALYRAKREGTLTAWTKALGYPVLGVGLVLDAVLNALVLSVVFLEPPRELLMTTRLKRHARAGTRPWSRHAVKWFRQFVDPFDPKGTHI